MASYHGTGAVKGSNNLTFVYNDEGIRTSKTVNGVVHTYQLNGSQIVAESWEDKLIVYLYDASGSPIGMMYRTTSYAIDSFDIFWFEKNLQGDIVAVYNSAGTKVAYYTYTDAWGNHSVGYINLATNEGVQYNPFRYRGYYYDTETGFYYLKSRYYDPNTCRFISPDNEAVLTATPMALTDKNLYAYCDNNPVMRVDEDGEFWLQFGIGAAVGFVSGVIDFLQSGEELSWIEVAKIGVSTLSGGVTAVVGPVAGALISGIAYGVNSALSGNDSEEIIVDSFVGALTSGIGSGMQLATGRILAGNFVQSASKTKLKMFANSLGYVGKNYKNALSWTGEIMSDASVEYMDKPIAQFVGYSIAFVSERINALIPR